jgi:Protein of unknown function (DUF3137)
VSSNLGLVLILGGIIGLWIVSIVAGVRKKAQRTALMAGAAAAAGLQPGNVPLPMGFLDMFMGDNKWVDNQFTSIADLTCTRTKGFTHCYTFATTFLQRVALPRVRVARRGIPDEDPMFGGMQKVELESIDFTNQFVVHSDDPRSAVMLLDLQMMQFIMDSGDVSFLIMGNLLVAYVYRARDSNSGSVMGIMSALKAVDVNQVGDLLKFIAGFPQHVPDLLRSDYPSPV